MQIKILQYLKSKKKLTTEKALHSPHWDLGVGSVC
jgi:hypothetical protein